jgi:Zn-dependent M28 family amino/carboxypeptidase
MLVTEMAANHGRRDERLEERLRFLVNTFAVPRDVFQQAKANTVVREEIADRLADFGYRVSVQGKHKNVLALPTYLRQPIPLVCAHLDSVSTTPGADDNASGLAVLIETAKTAALAGTPVAFLAPNAEEHNLAGSREFVAAYQHDAPFKIRAAHVLEMVGFASNEAGSQAMPPGIASPGLDVGDFLALAANHRSIKELKRVRHSAKLMKASPKVVALRAYFGFERFIPDIYRSDHAPFWRAGLPALLWTDTAEFRNPHYHRRGDTPDTLNYEFMSQVARLLINTLGIPNATSAMTQYYT